MQRLRALLAILALTAAACATEGPRLALPAQDLVTPVPDGYVRVVFFNDTNEALYPASGNIRVQLNGRTAPSLYLNHYSQLFLEPGSYELMLEHWDLLTFTDRYQIELREPVVYIRIWCRPISTRYEIVDALPDDFQQLFTGGRDMTAWPPFEP